MNIKCFFCNAICGKSTYKTWSLKLFRCTAYGHLFHIEFINNKLSYYIISDKNYPTILSCKKDISSYKSDTVWIRPTGLSRLAFEKASKKQKKLENFQ